MADFIEIDEKKKTIKKLPLEELSVEELDKYIDQLKEEIDKVKIENKKRSDSKEDVEKLFKQIYLIFKPLNLFWNLAT